MAVDVFGKAVAKDETFIIAFNRHETQSRTLSIDVSGIAEDTWINIIGVPQIGRCRQWSNEAHLAAINRRCDGAVRRTEDQTGNK